MDSFSIERMTLTQQQLADNFMAPIKYRKQGTVEARLAYEGETIVTVIDGEIETINHAHEGDIVICAVKNEEYIISRDKFDARYRGAEPTSLYQSYEPCGTTYAVPWYRGPAVFKASWGEDMIINNGDYLCSPTLRPDGDLYRIEADAFLKSYTRD